MIQKFHAVKTHLKVFSTGGTAMKNLIGFLPGYGWVWYHPNGIANILSLARMIKKYRVLFDSATDNEFHVYVREGRV